MPPTTQSPSHQTAGFEPGVNNPLLEVSSVSVQQTTPPPSPKPRDLHDAITCYLMHEAPEFQRLSELRRKGWGNPKGDRFFEKQRQAADNADKKTAKQFFKIMKEIGQEMHRVTSVFRINDSEPIILDMCMAPGGFLATALKLNPGARALGFSLPSRDGGHNALLPRSPNISLKFLDITMLAGDMGRVEIPTDHPDAGKFLPRQFTPQEAFDLVICDGQVLRQHARAPYRERREASRLTLTQLALGLEHVKPGGAMVVLLHKVESSQNAQLLYTFEQFASVQLFKHGKFHAKRSSFYMLATNIRNHCWEARTAISEWKRMWDIATFGTEEEYRQMFYMDDHHVDIFVKNFGPRLAVLGKHVWDTQANALAKASFLKENGHPGKKSDARIYQRQEQGDTRACEGVGTMATGK